MARTSVPTRTISASETATVSGSRSVNRVPAPAVVSTAISPPSRATLVRTTSRPTPRPAAAVTFDAVLNPGRKMKSRMSRSLSRVRISGVTSRVRSAVAFTDSRSMPRPSSATSTTMAPPFWIALTRTLPCGGLPLAWRSAFGFDAVGDGVLDQMQERFADLLDHGVVQLDRLAADIEHHGLAGGPRRLPHLAREAGEEAADGNHPGPGDLAPQLTGELLHRARRPRARRGSSGPAGPGPR